MLPREQLGRRHQCGLRAGLHGGRHGEQRNDGLAAADIALKQTQHAVMAREIGVDLAERAILRAGQLEGEGGEDRLAQLAGSSELSPGAPLEPRADHRERKLIGEQLVISEPGPCRRRGQEIGVALGRMLPGERLGESRPGILADECRIGPFRQGGQMRQRFGDRLAQRRVGEAGRQRIDRLMQGQGARPAFDVRHMVRVRHLQPAII